MRLLAFVLAVMATFTTFGINHVDSVKVYFRVGHRQFDPSLGDNRQKMDSFINLVRKASAAGEIENIDVRAYASPEGTNRANELLARGRCDAIADYIVNKAGISSRLITKIPEGVAWEGLRELVEVTPEVPSRLSVLDILANTPLWVFDSNGKVVNGRKKRLMSLDRGIPYRWMEKHLFPQLRNAVAITMITRGEPESGEEKDSEPEVTSREEEVREVTEEQVSVTEVSDVKTEVTEEPIVISKRFYTNDLMAIKTNLLYDAALLPNLEVEWLINPHWSVSVEGAVAWWKNDSRHKYYQLAYVSPEVRYHIRPRGRWHGMYVGAFAGGGLYDLENGGTGYRGEGGFGGVSFGYMWTVRKRLLFDAEVGVGYMGTQYKEYEPRDGHYLYMRTKTLNYFGPLKLKFSIGWLFGRVYAPNKN